MINVVHVDVNCNDARKITSLELKLKFIETETDKLNSHIFTAQISMAFFKTTLLEDAGKCLKIIANPKRPCIINMVIDLEKDNLTCHDVANFLEAFQKALDETKVY